MEKRVIIFVVFVLFFAGVFLVSSQSITGEIVTGEVTNEVVGFNITITGSPTLTIVNPRNETYYVNESMLFKADSSANNLWYNLDNGVNVSVDESATNNIFEATFNTSSGGHTVYVFANNSDGITEDNVTFNVDSSIWNVSYENYKGATAGSTTNFDQTSFEQLQNLTNITIEHTTYGKIVFAGVINVTDVFQFFSNLTNLDTNTNISSNRIEINSTDLIGFNTSATLTLYDLSFTTPRILKDGSVCPSSICVQNSYSGGNLSFNVTQFTTYSVDETPVDVAPSSGGGGGGGSTVLNFVLDKETISHSIKVGHVVEDFLILTNNEGRALSFEVEFVDLEEFARIEGDSSFRLSSKESKTLDIDFSVEPDVLPGLHLGKILIKSGTTVKEVLVSIDVLSESSLFDVLLSIPEKYLIVSPGGDVVADLNIFNLGDIGRVDVGIEYFILDQDGNVIISEKETSAIETRLMLMKRLTIPDYVIDGMYLLHVEVTHPDGVASASKWFEVGGPALSPYRSYSILMGLVVLVILVIMFSFYVHHRKEHRLMEFHRRHHKIIQEHFKRYDKKK